jgi:hypothetical protein
MLTFASQRFTKAIGGDARAFLSEAATGVREEN